MRVSERGVADGGRLIGRRSYRMTSVHSTTRAREGPRRAAATPGVARTRQARASPPSSLHAGVAIQRRACRAVSRPPVAWVQHGGAELALTPPEPRTPTRPGGYP